ALRFLQPPPTNQAQRLPRLCTCIGDSYILTTMDNSSDAHSRHRCAACYRQFNRMEHLVEHMRTSHHSHHEPRC
uniref:C2H2-type domain-containing protein n=1 Tax=Triticum urartu TaxID=4572 RepID=A0A8R7PNW3_TRIUA